jgi:hypothetical protein
MIMDVQPACCATTGWSSFHGHQLIPSNKTWQENPPHSTVLKTWAIGCMWTIAFEQRKKKLEGKKTLAPKRAIFPRLNLR